MPTYENDESGSAYQGPIAIDQGGYARARDQLKLGPSNNLTDPLRNFKFVVNINHKPSNTSGILSQGLGFMSVSGLAATTEAIPYREGGMNTTVHQLPGQTSFSPVTLQRGVTLGGNSAGPWSWFRQLFDVVGGAGTGPVNRPSGNNFRCSVDINVLEHPVTHLASPSSGAGPAVPVKLRVILHNAWITGISFSDLNAGDNAVMVEQMTLVHEGFMVLYGPPAPNQSAKRGNQLGL